MQRLKLLMTELAARYGCAVIVGLGFLGFSDVFAVRLMNHLGMHGSILPFELGLLMLFEVPVWMLLAWLLKPVSNGPLIEVVLASLVAVAATQILYFHLFWDNFILPTVNPATKAMMLFWYVVTLTNYVLATLTAILFCILHGVWIKRKARIAGHA